MRRRGYHLLWWGEISVPDASAVRIAEEIGSQYEVGAPPWMSTEIFFRWLRGFDEYISSKNGRKVLLFLDDASWHGRPSEQPALNDVRVEFLLKLTTLLLQPQDLGIIACLKRRYQLCQRGVDLIGDGHFENICRVDLNIAITWVYDIWDRIEIQIIHNCWLKSMSV